MRNHYFKHENKTDNSDFTIFGIKIGPVSDLQELPYFEGRGLGEQLRLIWNIHQ